MTGSVLTIARGQDRTANTVAMTSIRRHLLIGSAAIVLLFGCAGVWAATTEFAGAVVAPGQLVVDSNDKKVQHLTGGVVAELNVHDGDRVKAGDVVLRLDDTITRANLAIVSKSLDEITAHLARLEAERDSAKAIVFPEELLARAGSPDVDRLMQGENNLFALRAVAREGQKSQLAERVNQLGEEIGGLNEQVAAKDIELKIITGELDGVRGLYEKKLVTTERVTQLERENARLQGERGSLVASIAQSKGKISEIKLQILQVDQDLRSDVAKDIREAQGKIAEMVERKVAAEDQLKRIDLRAPQDGVVHQLSVHTVGGVINAGESVMQIVPDDDDLLVEAKIPPQEIDNVRQGQPASLRLSAFNQRTTPQADGEVQRVSADLSTDDRTGQKYYTVRISLKPEGIAALKGLRLVPGMPVEAFIQTSSRTVLSYLTRPLADQVRRAFREK